MGSGTTCPECGLALPTGSAVCRGCGRNDESLLSTEASPRSHSRLETPGQRLGDFQILRLLGRGGMGTVYEAYQDSMRRQVALKVLDTGIAPSSGAVARFEREAWIGGRLSHPNIVKVYGQGEAGGWHYIAMELVEGQSLHQVVTDAKEREAGKPARDSSWRTGHLRRVVELFLGVTDALHYVHEQGIVHRDIKPSNLLVTKDGSRLVVTDFGLARDEEASRMTRRGDFLGTVRYMSPEQLLAHRVKVDRRSDIYSLGVSLYEAVTLHLPFEADSEEAYIGAVSTREPAPARSRERSVPRDIETILMKCLERDPARRYGSAMALKDDLLRYLEERPVLARRPGVVTKSLRLLRRHRWHIAAGAAAAACAGAVMGVWEHQKRTAYDVERTRWVLEQMIANGSYPEDLAPDWAHLRQELIRRTERNSRSDLALLALRAIARTTVSLPTFGLVSELPSLGVFFGDQGLRQEISPHLKFLWVVEVEGSWDGGAWASVTQGFWSQGATSGVGRRLSDFLSHDQLTPGPHQLKLQARMRLWIGEDLTHRRLTSGKEGPAGFFLDVDRAKATAPVYQEVRELGSVSISLYEAYPKDFPHAVPVVGSLDELKLPIKFDTILVLRIQAPEGTGRSLHYTWPDGQPAWLRVSSATRAQSHELRALELTGDFGRDFEPAVAALAEVWTEGGTRPVARLGLAWPLAGISRVIFGNGWTAARYWGPRSGPERLYADPSDFESVLHGIGDLPPDGTYRGRIDLIPSREVARETQQLSRYLDARLSFPVPVEVRTVRGEWVADEPQQIGLQPRERAGDAVGRASGASSPGPPPPR